MISITTATNTLLESNFLLKCSEKHVFFKMINQIRSLSFQNIKKINILFRVVCLSCVCLLKNKHCVKYTWCFHPLVVVRINTNFVSFELKGVLAIFKRMQFVVCLKIWPPPQATVNYMRQSFTLGYLKTAV
jgi:hypothetical protein